MHSEDLRCALLRLSLTGFARLLTRVSPPMTGRECAFESPFLIVGPIHSPFEANRSQQN